MAGQVVDDISWIAIAVLFFLIVFLLVLVSCYYIRKRRRRLISDVECKDAEKQPQSDTNTKSTTTFSESPPLQMALLKQPNANYGTTKANNTPTELERALEAPFIDVLDAVSKDDAKSDDDAHSSASSEVGRIVEAGMDGEAPARRGLTRNPSKGRTMSLLTPELYGSVRARSAKAQQRSNGDDEPADGVNQPPKCISPRPVSTTDEPLVYGKLEVQLDLLHLPSLDEIVITVKQGKNFDPTQTYAVLITVNNNATQSSQTLETAHINGLEQPRWNEQIVFGGIKEDCLGDVTITVAVIRKYINDLWEDEGHIVLSEVSPHDTGRNHFMQMMAKDGSAARWHRVAVSLF